MAHPYACPVGCPLGTTGGNPLGSPPVPTQPNPTTTILTTQKGEHPFVYALMAELDQKVQTVTAGERP